MDENIKILEELENDFITQRDTFQNLFNQNLLKIEKVDSYLKDLAEKEDEDFSVFSPRSIDSVYKNRIEAENTQKAHCEEENKVYKERIDKLDEQIKKINIVLHNLIAVEPDGKKTGIAEQQADDLKNVDECNRNLADEKNRILENNHFAHQILECVLYMPLDLERAKSELTVIAKKMTGEY